MLSDWSLERAGRITKEKPPANVTVTPSSSSSSGSSCSVSAKGPAAHTVRTAGMIVKRYTSPPISIPVPIPISIPNLTLSLSLT